MIGYDPLPSPRTLGEELVRKRVLCGLTQKESAHQIGVDQTTFARWERDERLSWGDGLDKLKRFLGFPVSEKAPDSLGKQIRNIRRNRELSQKALAERFGLKRSTVAMWETDRQKPRGRLMEEVAKFLALSL